MNYTYWEGELEIFRKDSVLEDDDVSLIHLWQPQEGGVVFKIPNTHKLTKTDDGYGNDIYVVERK